MIIKNPTQSKVSIVIKGQTYAVDAEGIISVSEDVGTHWIGIHQFLTVATSIPEQVKPVEVEQEVDPETETEDTAEEKEEPKKKVTKTKNK